MPDACRGTMAKCRGSGNCRVKRRVVSGLAKGSAAQASLERFEAGRQNPGAPACAAVKQRDQHATRPVEWPCIHGPAHPPVPYIRNNTVIFEVPEVRASGLAGAFARSPGGRLSPSTRLPATTPAPWSGTGTATGTGTGTSVW